VITFSFDTLWGLFTMVFWPFVRLLALFSSAPILSNRAIPTRVRVLLALLIALLIGPNIAPPPAGADPLGLLLQQLLIGIIVGFAMRIVFAAIEYAGDVAGLQIGLGFAMFVDPTNSRQTPLVGSFLNLLAMLVFLSINGHLILIASLVETFQVVPLAGPIDGGFNMFAIAQWGGEIFRIGFSLALPIITAILLVNLSLGVMARVAPQLSIFSVGFALTLIIGLVMLYWLLPYFAMPLEQHLSTPLWTKTR